jgi:hypothetical protein
MSQYIKSALPRVEADERELRATVEEFNEPLRHH